MNKKGNNPIYYILIQSLPNHPTNNFDVLLLLKFSIIFGLKFGIRNRMYIMKI